MGMHPVYAYTDFEISERAAKDIQTNYHNNCLHINRKDMDPIEGL